jgi:hypothetical protein
VSESVFLFVRSSPLSCFAFITLDQDTERGVAEITCVYRGSAKWGSLAGAVFTSRMLQDFYIYSSYASRSIRSDTNGSLIVIRSTIATATAPRQ